MDYKWGESLDTNNYGDNISNCWRPSTQHNYSKMGCKILNALKEANGDQTNY